MSEVFHHDISRDFYIFLMKKALIDLLGYITPCWSWLSKKRTHPSGFKVMPLDDADEPWCGKGEGHGEHFLSYFRLVSGDFQENNSWLFKHRVFFCFFEFLKDPEAAIFVKGILAYFWCCGGGGVYGSSANVPDRCHPAERCDRFFWLFQIPDVQVFFVEMSGQKRW